jgi:phosphoserine phosphatase RsbU/P
MKVNQANKEEFDWKFELKQTAFRYHVLIATVAVVLNPIFAIADYFNIPDHFSDFLYVRLVNSVLIFFVLLNKNKFISNPEWIALVPFLGISIQNAYMYSVMDALEIQKHTFSYIALFIGAGMFVLWNFRYSIMVVIISFLSNIFFYSLHGRLSIEEVLTNGGLLTFAVALFTILLIDTRTKLVKKEIISRFALAESNKQLAIKNEVIEEQNAEVKASLNYAKRIQESILPPLEKIEEDFDDYFVLYQPKDIVSGDFYWYTKVRTTPKQKELSEELILFSVADCTGHGVPGALMSIIGNTILNQSLTEKSVNSPAEALSYLNLQIIKNLKSINDGMDVSFCAFNPKTLVLQYAGANNPLYLIRNQELRIIKADKQAIGGSVDILEEKLFTNHILQLEKGDAIYLFSDGYADQFGGPESYTGGKKFKYNRFKNLLVDIHQKPMTKQKEILIQEFEAWKGNLEQVDDVCIFGVRV